MYEQTDGGHYVRIVGTDQFIFFDTRRDITAIVDHENIVILKSSFRGPRGKKGSTGRRGCRGGTPGLSGSPGPQGVSGSPSQSVSGAQGISGAPGSTGISGAPGEGISGAPGGQGISGAPGGEGISGAPGEGISGAPGGEGISGAPGGEGISGAPGGEGISGSPGSTGLSGAPGGEGISGAPGSTGLSGASGTEGISGAPGTSANPTYAFIYNMVFISGEISGLPPPPPPPQQTLSPATNPPNASQYVVFNSTGPHYGITFNGSNALTLLVTGDYLANYSASFVPNGGNAFSIKLIDNTVDVPGSVITSNSPVLNGSVEFSANAGDQISLANNMQNFATLVTQYSSSASPPVVTLVNSTVNASISGSPVTSLTTGPISYINPTSIYVGIQYHFGTTISVTVNDNHGGIYTQVPSSPSGGNALAIFYQNNVPPNQSVNVTVIFSGGTVDAVVELLQFYKHEHSF